MPERSAHVVRPGDPDYRWALSGYSRRTWRAPREIVFASQPEHVCDTVKMCKAHGIPLVVRNSRFGQAEGYFESGSIILDVSRINTIALARSGDTVSVGAGTTSLVVADVLSTRSARVPMGMHPDVSLVGTALAGGLGMACRSLGLTCDAMLEAEVVDADGQLVRASAAENSDLFWALRGAGCAGFGIVTYLTLRTAPACPVVLFDVDWRSSDADEVWDAWQDWAPAADGGLTSALSFSGSSVRMSGQFQGTEHRLLGLMSPMLRAGTAVNVATRRMNQRDAVRAFAEPEGPHPMLRWGVAVSAPMTHEARRAVLVSVGDAPVDARVRLIALGGAVSDRPAESSAFPWRNSPYIMETTAHWASPTAEPSARAWAAEAKMLTADYAAGSYAGWPDPDNPDWLKSAYGNNLSRLRRLHVRWDPYNVFKSRFGIGWE